MIGRCGSSMLRPSPNHGTLWLHIHYDDDGDDAPELFCLPRPLYDNGMTSH